MQFGLIIGFSFCVILLLFFLRFTSIDWRFKASMILSSLIVIFCFYKSLVSILGYPVDYQPDCVMLLEGIDVREPKTNDPGSIYIWYIDVDEAIISGKPGIPRSIHIPYSKSDAKMMAKASQEMKEKPVFMRFKKKDDNTGDSESSSDGLLRQGKGNGGIKIKGKDERESEGSMDFIAPENTTPEKTE